MNVRTKQQSLARFLQIVGFSAGGDATALPWRRRPYIRQRPDAGPFSRQTPVAAEANIHRRSYPAKRATLAKTADSYKCC